MRALSYIIATVLLLTGPSMAGPSMAGPPDHDLPGVGTFAYNGPVVLTQIPAVMAANDASH
jgi:hypothetical protein